MIETVFETIEVLKEDETISDVLQTVGAAPFALADCDFSIEQMLALSVILKAAEKRIMEITQSKQ